MPSVKRNVKKRPPVYWRSTAGVYSNNRQEKNFGMENSQAIHTESATQASRDRTPGLRRYLAAKSPGRNYDRLNHEPHDLVCAAPVWIWIRCQPLFSMGTRFPNDKPLQGDARLRT